MKHGQGDATIYTCDFCGMSSKGAASMFVSSLDRKSAICKPCVEAMLPVYGKVVEVLGERDRRGPVREG